MTEGLRIRFLHRLATARFDFLIYRFYILDAPTSVAWKVQNIFSISVFLMDLFLIIWKLTLYSPCTVHETKGSISLDRDALLTFLWLQGYHINTTAIGAPTSTWISFWSVPVTHQLTITQMSLYNFHWFMTYFYPPFSSLCICCSPHSALRLHRHSWCKSIHLHLSIYHAFFSAGDSKAQNTPGKPTNFHYLPNF